METKIPGCGLDGVSDASPEACANGTKAMLEANLKELNMSYVDLVLIHEPPAGAFSSRSCHLVCDQVKAQWKVVQEFYEQRKARAVGVSNYCYSCMECLDWNATVTPMVNQVEYHIGMGTSPAIHGDKGMKTFADAHGVVMQAYSALGGDDTFRKAIIKGELETEIAKAHNVSSVRAPPTFHSNSLDFPSFLVGARGLCQIASCCHELPGERFRCGLVSPSRAWMCKSERKLTISEVFLFLCG